MKLFARAALLLCIGPLALSSAEAQVSLTTLGSPTTQSFDTLPASGSATWANNSTIPGWYHARTGTGTTIVANDGASNSGNLYSYGTGTATDRALGSVGSSNAAAGNFFYGIRLVNNTGSTITSLDISYVGEQWRNSAVAAHTATFSYLVGSPTVTGSLAEFQTAGTAVSALDFTSPITGGTASALNGNLAANRTAISFSITGLSIPNGTEVILRWSDPDQTGADHGLSIDDFSVTPQGGGPANLSINDVSLNEGNAGTTNFTFTVSLSVAGRGRRRHLRHRHRRRHGPGRQPRHRGQRLRRPVAHRTDDPGRELDLLLHRPGQRRRRHRVERDLLRQRHQRHRRRR